MSHSQVTGAPLVAEFGKRLTHVVSQLARDKPDNVALVLEDQAVSFAELHRRARNAETLFAKHGVGAGDRIVWCGLNHPDFFAALLAAMRTGAVLVPINWRLKVREIAGILADCIPSLIIADAAFRATMAEAGAAAANIVVTSDFSNSLDDAAPADNPACGTWEEPTLLLYTSGTTGAPKGVQLSEKAASIARQMEALSGAFEDWTDQEILLSPLPLFHIGGISWALCGLVRGCPVVLTNDASPPALLDLCLSAKISRTFLVPQLVRGLIEEMVSRQVCIATLKGIHYGAAPMDAALLARGIATIGCRFLQYFGMTEMGGTISILPPADHDPARPLLLQSVGRVLPGTDIEIRDAQGEIVPVGEAGEIWTRGPSIMLGYVNRPEQTAEAIVDGWYRTGDGGRLDGEGFLYLTDRIKDMIVTGGENVYPGEVEAILREHPAVADCAVFGLPDAVWGERVCATIELRPDASFDREDIMAFVTRQIAGYKSPRQIETIAALPRTASGKIQRAKARLDMLAQTDAHPDLSVDGARRDRVPTVRADRAIGRCRNA